MLSHLVYLSVKTPLCTDLEIEKILASCKKNNASLDITGVLLYTETKFLQYLEGEQEEIMNLYLKIKKDPRHSTCILISGSEIKNRAFPSWQMGSKKIDSNVSFLTEISEEDKIQFAEIFQGKENENASVIISSFFKFNKVN
ncbi:MAG: BLUF domain-containing protein [Cytophagales bacterium]|nr:MAG: BLUF domain-containing protein [Cytophagales bacterium]